MPKNMNLEFIHFSENSSSVALVSPNRTDLSYLELNEFIGQVARKLSSIVDKKNKKIGYILPNSSDAVSFFLAACRSFIAAPLNPLLTKSEYMYYIKDLDIAVLVVQKGQCAAAIKAAKVLQIKIIYLDPTDVSGIFYLTYDGKGLTEAESRRNNIDDICLVLHTSGTTSQPKIVQLDVKNVVTSAQNIKASLKLSKKDRCLSIMPLFHIHGLIACTLAPLYSGGTIICSGGFDALKFFNLVNQFEPSWYSAVPTMHQLILERADRQGGLVNNTKFRFIRSSSAPLPKTIYEKLELKFRCPVIEAYGMTEAAHQMTSNPLPPLKRKVGSVGIEAGSKIRVIGKNGEFLNSNITGEIVVRGDNVTRGYAKNPKANKKCFIDGWFRTGDQGFIDYRGYLTITGRLKELINRGGEKISPVEIDNEVLQHPAVSQAVTFSLPDSKLGEKTCVAIVLKTSTVLSPTELKKFLKLRLSRFKIPDEIVFVNDIPKGNTGKLQRLSLAKTLGLIE